VIAGIVVGVLLLAYVLRSLPSWLSPQGVGVDHWFWKAYIETYRRDRRFPPELPQYVLDEAQWYPPFFPMLLARLPAAFFDRWSHLVAVMIDLARLLLLLGVAAWQSDGSPTVILVAGLVYATTPIQVSYNIQLNPRGLAALMLDALLMAMLYMFYTEGSWPLWSVIVVLGGLILLTHKMTTQLFWFIALGTGILYQRWQLVALIPASIIAALVMSRGFYWKVLIAHWDIVSFWDRNWRWIGADPIRESTVYGDGTYERPAKLHKSGFRGVTWHLFILFGFNPAAWVSCLLIYERVFVPSPFLIYPTYLLLWLLLPCAFALLTSFVPRLKCLGAGYLYVYNTSLVCSLLLALTYRYTRSPGFSTAFMVVALGLNVLGLVVYFREFLSNKRTRVDQALERLIAQLGRRSRGVVMCIPTNFHEVVAYKSGQPVLWGAHGYGFKRFEPIWPRLQLPLTEIIARYHVRYLLTMDGMLTPAVEAELAGATLFSEGEYRLYCLDPAPGDLPDHGVGQSPSITRHV